MTHVVWLAFILAAAGAVAVAFAPRLGRPRAWQVLLAACALGVVGVALVEGPRAEAVDIPVPSAPMPVPAPAPIVASPAPTSGSAARIGRLLAQRRSPLRGQERAIVAAGRAAGVRPEFIVAIAGIESNFGRVGAPVAGFNAWGVTRSGGGYARFASWPEGVRAVARMLAGDLYAGAGLTHLPQIAARWCPPGASNDAHGTNYLWPDLVGDFLESMGVPRTAQLTGLSR